MQRACKCKLLLLARCLLGGGSKIRAVRSRVAAKVANGFFECERYNADGKLRALQRCLHSCCSWPASCKLLGWKCQRTALSFGAGVHLQCCESCRITNAPANPNAPPKSIPAFYDATVSDAFPGRCPFPMPHRRHGPCRKSVNSSRRLTERPRRWSCTWRGHSTHRSCANVDGSRPDVGGAECKSLGEEVLSPRPLCRGGLRVT